MRAGGQWGLVWDIRLISVVRCVCVCVFCALLSGGSLGELWGNYNLTLKTWGKIEAKKKIFSHIYEEVNLCEREFSLITLIIISIMGKHLLVWLGLKLWENRVNWEDHGHYLKGPVFVFYHGYFPCDFYQFFHHKGEYLPDVVEGRIKRNAMWSVQSTLGSSLSGSY